MSEKFVFLFIVSLDLIRNMHIVLVEPAIPQNTGSIARTCAATKTPLHLIHPLGFEITEKAVRRAGLDYWEHVDLRQHDSFEDFLQQQAPKELWFFTKYGRRPYYEAPFGTDSYLVFGSETTGLGEEFLMQHPEEQKLIIPMDEPAVRSLNLSNAVSIALYEARRQLVLL